MERMKSRKLELDFSRYECDTKFLPSRGSWAGSSTLSHALEPSPPTKEKRNDTLTFHMRGETCCFSWYRSCLLNTQEAVVAVSPNVQPASSMRLVSRDTRIKEATYLIRSKAITEIFEACVIAFRKAAKGAEFVSDR